MLRLRGLVSTQIGYAKLGRSGPGSSTWVGACVRRPCGFRYPWLGHARLFSARRILVDLDVSRPGLVRVALARHVLGFCQADAWHMTGMSQADAYHVRCVFPANSGHMTAIIWHIGICLTDNCNVPDPCLPFARLVCLGDRAPGFVK